MPKYLITPIDPSDPAWEHWDPTPNPVTARDEDEARTFASIEAGVGYHSPGKKMDRGINPWKNEDKTRVEVIDE